MTWSWREKNIYAIYVFAIVVFSYLYAKQNAEFDSNFCMCVFSVLQRESSNNPI